MTDKQIAKSIKALARGECANYRDGFCLETDERCHVINKDYETVHDGLMNCDYFWECVLPSDWDLNDVISYALWYDKEDEDEIPDNMRLCAECRQPFVFTSNRQKYCHSCSQSVQRRQGMLRQRKFTGRD